MEKKIKINNLVNLIFSCIIFIFEIMPESVKWVGSNGPNSANTVYLTSYIMDVGLMLWGIGFLTLIIVLLTITNIIINAVTLLDDRNKLKITTLVTTFICLLGSIILIMLMRQYVTLQNIFIMVFFLIQIILLIDSLRMSYKQKKLNSVKEESNEQ